MTSYHVSVLYITSIGIGCSNNGAQFNKCTLHVCTKYALIKLPQYVHSIQYLASGIECLVGFHFSVNG